MTFELAHCGSPVNPHVGAGAMAALCLLRECGGAPADRWAEVLLGRGQRLSSPTARRTADKLATLSGTQQIRRCVLESPGTATTTLRRWSRGFVRLALTYDGWCDSHDALHAMAPIMASCDFTHTGSVSAHNPRSRAALGYLSRIGREFADVETFAERRTLVTESLLDLATQVGFDPGVEVAGA